MSCTWPHCTCEEPCPEVLAETPSQLLTRVRCPANTGRPVAWPCRRERGHEGEHDCTPPPWGSR